MARRTAFDDLQPPTFDRRNLCCVATAKISRRDAAWHMVCRTLDVEWHPPYRRPRTDSNPLFALLCAVFNGLTCLPRSFGSVIRPGVERQYEFDID